MSGLASAATASELIEGDVATAEALSGRVRSVGAVLGSASWAVRDVRAGDWYGTAAEAAEARISELPPMLSQAVEAFAEASSALEEWARQLHHAQTLAATLGVRARRINEIVRSFRNVHSTLPATTS